MRTNLPVTHQEFVIPEGVTLVSTTDLQSRITYCNPAFVAVSGFEREELIGQLHNLVRHPDMPTASTGTTNRGAAAAPRDGFRPRTREERCPHPDC